MSVVLSYQDEGEDEIFHFDATIREVHNWSAEATKHPVELDDENLTTRKITDHIIHNGVTLQLTGVISDDHITVESANAGNSAGLIGGIIGGGLGAITTAVLAKRSSDLIRGDVKASAIVFLLLTAIYEESIPVSINTGLNNYFNMVMEDLTMNRTAANGGGLSIEATFFQIQTVVSQVTDIPESAQDIKVAGENTTVGKVSAKAAPVSPPVDKRGVVLKAAQSLGFLK